MGKKGKKGKGEARAAAPAAAATASTVSSGGRWRFTAPAERYGNVPSCAIKDRADDALERGDTDMANELLVELNKRMPVAIDDEHGTELVNCHAETGAPVLRQSVYSLKVQAENYYGSGDIENATGHLMGYLANSRLRQESGDGDSAISRDGDYQLGREKYRAAFEKERNSDPWTTYRYYYFMNYTENIVVEEGQNSSHDEADVKLLARIFNDETEPALFRASASFALARIHDRVKHDLAEATEYYRLTIRQCESATAEEKRRIALTPPGKNILTVGAILGMLQKPSQERLSILNLIYNDMGPRQMSLGGDKCDRCGKTCEQLGIPSLQRCSRCSMAYFCSKECFRTQWNTGGHKKSCRKPGQFEIGDYCRFGDKLVWVSAISDGAGSSGGGGANNYPNNKQFKVVTVQLEEARSDRQLEEMRWPFIIEGQAGGECYSASADELERTRPADVIS